MIYQLQKKASEQRIKSIFEGKLVSSLGKTNGPYYKDFVLLLKDKGAQKETIIKNVPNEKKLMQLTIEGDFIFTKTSNLVLDYTTFSDADKIIVDNFNKVFSTTNYVRSTPS